MKLLSTILIFAFCICLNAQTKIHGLIISNHENIPISNISIEIPLLNITTKSEINGKFELILPENLSPTENIYLYFNDNTWFLVPPNTGKLISILPYERDKQLIIKMNRLEDKYIPEEYTKKGMVYKNKKPENTFQIQVGALKKNKLKNKTEIAIEGERLEKLLGEEVNYIDVPHSDNPHKFVLKQTFSSKKEALKKKEEIREKKGILAHLF